MPKKRPIDERIDEAKERLAKLNDEKRLQELQRRIRNRQPRRRRTR